MKLIIEENEQKMSESAMHILLGSNECKIKESTSL